jgi:hypothetical protein
VVTAEDKDLVARARGSAIKTRRASELNKMLDDLASGSP